MSVEIRTLACREIDFGSEEKWYEIQITIKTTTGEASGRARLRDMSIESFHAAMSSAAAAAVSNCEREVLRLENALSAARKFTVDIRTELAKKGI